MATYVPSADQLTEPTGDKPVKSAAPEFRAMKAKLARALTVPEAGEYPDFPSVVDRANKVMAFGSLGEPIAIVGVDEDSAAALQLLLGSLTNVNAGSHLIGYLTYLAGGVGRLLDEKLGDFVSLKDFGAIGTADPANEATDTAALTDALASGKNFIIPQGSYYFSIPIAPAAGVKVLGAGRGKTAVFYSGTGNGVFMGVNGPAINLTYDMECGGFTLVCTNRASTVKGVVLRNAVYSKVHDMTIIGSGNPNSADPLQNTLYGSGLDVSDNSILCTVERVSCRVWEKGMYYWTGAASQSMWSAAIEVHDCEVATNMDGLVIGDPTVSYVSAVGVHFHDIWVQGNYRCGIRNYSGENTTFDNIYYEGNANYDYDQGGGAALPIKCRIHRSGAATEDIGTTVYGTFPYLAKFRIRTGSFTTIIDNDCSISTAIPLIQVDAAAEETLIQRNRLNSAIAVSGRISNASATTRTADNSPEAPRVLVGSFTRALDAASAAVAYTGIGFRPTNIEFTASVDSQVEYSLGAATDQSGILNRCLSSDGAGAKLSSGDCIRIIRASAGNEQKAVLATMGADGFTLTWTKVGTPPAGNITVNYVARR